MIEDILIYLAPYLSPLTYKESGELYEKISNQRGNNQKIALERQALTAYFRFSFVNPTPTKTLAKPMQPKPIQHLPARKRFFPALPAAAVNEKNPESEKNKKLQPQPPKMANPAFKKK